MRAWGEARDWEGFDPYDGLNTPFAPVLTFGRPLGKRILAQAVKQSPVNLRPLLRIRPARNAKAIALVASAYANLARAGDDEAARAATRWLDWLLDHSDGGPGTLAWGYHFDVQTRFFGYPRGTPNAIASSFAAHALLDGFELLGDARWGEAATTAADDMMRRLLVNADNRTYFRYVENERELVHNANLLCCSVLARTSQLLEAPKFADVARSALACSLAAQRPDGAWPYADADEHGWVDNFHTGYVLESLAHCAALDDSIPDRLQRGLAFWDRELFLDDGTPRYDTRSLYPLDAHCYASAIDTWVAVRTWNDEAIEHATRVAQLLIDQMLDPEGYVHFQRRRHWTNKVPFVRWTTAPSFRALARLLAAQQEASA
jgi:uncharacterized protein YyaL (SSP411 family)